MTAFVPSAPEVRRSLPGLRPLSLDAEARTFTDRMALGIAGKDLFVLRTQIVDSGARQAIAWRNSGPQLRLRRRLIPEFATIGSLALERGLRLTRAFIAEPSQWRRGLPRFQIGDELLRPEQVVKLLPSGDETRDAAVARVADVRALYGRMLSDVAYRIENSAMFDSAVPTSNRFETALTLWADVTEATPASEVVRLAGLVKITFDTATAHAELLGLDHVPDMARDDARRAAGAARLAASGATPGERQAAYDTTVRILASLSLYYLPRLDRAQLGVSQGDPTPQERAAD